MITPARVKQLLQLNLADERMTASALFIQNLIEREVYGSGVERYRIKDTVTGLWVPNLAALIAGIDETKLEIRYAYEGERLQTDRVTGFIVRSTQYEVVWTPIGKSDSKFSNFFNFSDQIHFLFFMAYMNDGDADLPIKISYTKLVP